MGQYDNGDLAAELVDETGEALWGHVSSSEGWLIHDLTQRPDRMERLQDLYPDGYEVAIGHRPMAAP